MTTNNHTITASAATAAAAHAPSCHVLHVAVGSTNPSKLRSVQQALERIVSRNNTDVTTTNVELYPCPTVSSGVPDQPMGDEETKLGAKNRARAAREEYRQRFGKDPHLAVGLEGGLEWLDNELWCMAWMAVCGSRSSFVLQCTASSDCSDFEAFEDDELCWGTAKTGTFALPQSVADLVKGGMELGDADDQVFCRIKAKHGSGTVGLLTDGLIDRSAYYDHALILALVPWLRPDVYKVGVE